MTNRDLIVLLLAILVAFIVAGIDLFIELSSEPRDALLTTPLFLSGMWGFYRLGCRLNGS